jgi:hypothetical protein
MVKKERALTRFRCGHCASRLVVQTRHLDRLVACHACGRATHPVAGRLAAAAVQPAGKNAAKPTAKPVAAAAPAVAARQPCGNCGQPIGKLQARREWGGETVCVPCHAKLAAEAALPARVASTPARSLAPSPSVRARQPAESPAVARPARAAARAVEAGDVPVLELSVAPLAPVLLFGAACVGFAVALTVMSYLGGLLLALALVAVAAVGVRWLRRGTSSVRARFEQISSLRRRHGASHVVAMLVAWIRAQPAGRLPYAVLLLLFWGAMYVPYRLGSVLQSARPAAPARLSA